VQRETDGQIEAILANTSGVSSVKKEQTKAPQVSLGQEVSWAEMFLASGETKLMLAGD